MVSECSTVQGRDHIVSLDRLVMETGRMTRDMPMSERHRSDVPNRCVRKKGTVYRSSMTILPNPKPKQPSLFPEGSYNEEFLE